MTNNDEELRNTERQIKVLFIFGASLLKSPTLRVAVGYKKRIDMEVKNLRQSAMIKDWMEKQSIHSSLLFNSTSSSSASSSGRILIIENKVFLQTQTKTQVAELQVTYWRAVVGTL
ncbi:hypothetical protein CIPAW_10G053700 [Carya illinoinensis]|uniref:Uncharacterized protein n=1 Tax=Carya illinoinensis TaxID=32201 RepID=A0A8T1PAG2_CARIL|nr:hypothetical protein CIPAW_10G053700 [Carya illinoinensis]